MKVAQICTNVMSGSVGGIVRQLYLGIKQNGDECMIFYGRGSEPIGFKAYKFDNDFDIYSHLMLARTYDADGFGSNKATKKLVSVLEKFDPDIVHIHCLHGYYINISILYEYFKKNNIKVVWTMHDCWAYTGHCTYYSFVGCEKWKKGCSDCVQKKCYPKSLFLDNSCRNFKKKERIFASLDKKNIKLVSPSNWLAEEIRESFLSNYEVLVIPNGVDNKFAPNNKTRKNNVILGVANKWDKRKGLSDFLELSRYIGNEYTIKLIGVSEKDKQRLENYKNIISINRTSNVQELIELYRSSLALFNPTYEDNYPTVNIEAIACGLPVITYPSGGSPEIVKKTNCGTVVPYKRYDLIINYLQKLSNDHNNFNINNCYFDSLHSTFMIKQYLDVYRKMFRNE